jgi:hypothetical protein
MIASVLGTSTAAHVAVRIDDDQKGMYSTIISSDRVKVSYGERKTVVALLNEMVEAYPGYCLYGMVPDDSVFTEGGWDAAMLGAVSGMPNRVGMIDLANGGDPKDGGTWWTDTPFVTDGWVQALGWFACPRFSHWCWPIITGALSACVHTVRLPASVANIVHHRDFSMVTTTHQSDENGAWPFLVEDFQPCVNRLKDAAMVRGAA